MKIKTNFSAGMQKLLVPAALSIWLSAITVLALLIWLIWDAFSLGHELPQLKEKLPALERAMGEMPPRESYTQQKLADMQKQVARLNSIALSKGLSTVALLKKLEALLPDASELTGLHYRAKERELLLQAQAASAEILSQFLLHLEQDAQLESVVLSQQKEINEDGKVIVQFEIRAKVRS